MEFLYTTIYLYNDEIYYVVDLDGNALSLDKLKKYCGKNAKGLKSDYHVINAVNGMLKPTNGDWYSFCTYECVIEPDTQTNAEKSLPSKDDSLGPTASEELNRESRLRLDFHLDTLWQLIVTLGETACDLLNKEARIALKETEAPIVTSKSANEVHVNESPSIKLAKKLRARRNQIVHERHEEKIRILKNPNEALMDLMENLVKKYRHLVCIGNGGEAQAYIPHQNIQDIINCGLEFPIATETPFKILGIIIRACFRHLIKLRPGRRISIHHVCQIVHTTNILI